MFFDRWQRAVTALVLPLRKKPKGVIYQPQACLSLHRNGFPRGERIHMRYIASPYCGSMALPLKQSCDGLTIWACMQSPAAQPQCLFHSPCPSLQPCRRSHFISP